MPEDPNKLFSTRAERYPIPWSGRRSKTSSPSRAELERRISRPRFCGRCTFWQILSGIDRTGNRP